MAITLIKAKHNCLLASPHRVQKPTHKANKLISFNLHSPPLNQLKQHVSHPQVTQLYATQQGDHYLVRIPEIGAAVLEIYTHKWFQILPICSHVACIFHSTLSQENPPLGIQRTLSAAESRLGELTRGLSHQKQMVTFLWQKVTKDSKSHVLSGKGVEVVGSKNINAYNYQHNKIIRGAIWRLGQGTRGDVKKVCE